jgi:hypothetical protein
MVALARAFGWTYRDIVETPYYILQGCLQVLAEERTGQQTSENPEWAEWEQHGQEWVRAQWPRTE